MIKVRSEVELLKDEMLTGGTQYFVVGLADSDGPLFSFTTTIEHGFYLSECWWQQPLWTDSGLQLITVLAETQSNQYGMRCFNWYPPLNDGALRGMYIDGTRVAGDRGTRPAEDTLVLRELTEADFGTFQRFDGGITKNYSFEWWDAMEGINRFPPQGETDQVAP